MPVIFSVDGISGPAQVTTLTDGVATTVLSLITEDGIMAGATITYTVESTDGSDLQAEQGTVHIAIVDSAGGVVASTPIQSSAQAVTGGTLSTDWTVVTTDDQSIEIQLTATSSLTTTTLQVTWRATVSDNITFVAA